MHKHRFGETKVFRAERPSRDVGINLSGVAVILDMLD
jgi:hypothetical protein